MNDHSSVNASVVYTLCLTDAWFEQILGYLKTNYILLFVFLINHDILGNSFVAFEFSGSSFMDMKIKRLTFLSVLRGVTI